MNETFEALSTQRISLAVEEFAGANLDEMSKILRSEMGRKYVGSLKFSKGMFQDRAIVEELNPFYRGIKGHMYPVIADVSLSGGYADSVKDVHATVKRHGLMNSIFTLSRIPEDEVRFITEHVVAPSEFHSIKFLLTGGLPENSSDDFRKLYNIGKKKFTEEKIEQAGKMKLHGVYASAGLIPYETDLFTLGAGISFEGVDYESDGVVKKSVTVEDGLARCSQFVVGRILFSNDRTITENFEKICEKIDYSQN